MYSGASWDDSIKRYTRYGVKSIGKEDIVEVTSGTTDSSAYFNELVRDITNATRQAQIRKYFTPKSIEVSADHRTIVVIWPDGHKEIVRRSPNDPDDIYMAFTAALAKRICGSNSQIKKIIREKVNEHKTKNRREGDST